MALSDDAYLVAYTLAFGFAYLNVCLWLLFDTPGLVVAVVALAPVLSAAGMALLIESDVDESGPTTEPTPGEAEA